jgi:SAM-dependent methyltransferase
MDMQNLYDDEAFFQGYSKIRANPLNTNVVIEQPYIRSLLSDLRGKRVLDLGCGAGEGCAEYLHRGAKHVVGIDISNRMIGEAKARNSHPGIEYQITSIEEYDFPAKSFDYVISSFVMQYLPDIGPVFRKISHTLAKNGRFIFSQEHPVITATIEDAGWHRDANGKKLHWKVDDYFLEGQRIYEWIVQGASRYHRPLQTVVDALLDAKFMIERIVEPTVTPEYAEKHSYFSDERRMPLILMIKAMKTN